jgi:transposase
LAQSGCAALSANHATIGPHRGLESTNDATIRLALHALLAELEERRNVVVACDTLWRFLKREGISFKKNAARQRAGSA